MTATEIRTIDVREMRIALREPFGIASGAQVEARNLLVRVTLTDGTVGHGEAAPFATVNGDTANVALAAIRDARPLLVGRDVRAWRAASELLRATMARSPSAVCALETAVLDAWARHHRVALWSVFGGVQRQLETDMTITTGSVAHVRDAALRIAREGYRTIKLKIGGVPLDDDEARVDAVVRAAPACGLLLDANGAMPNVDAALRIIRAATNANGRVVLFEQPLSPTEPDAMREFTARGGVAVAADESASSVADVVRIAQRREAHVVNLKIMKSGVIEALDMATSARALGLRLMIGGMVETAMAMSMSACIAAGLGGFDHVDLDTPAWLLDAPITGGIASTGPRIDLAGITAGHGATERASAIDTAWGAG